MKAVGNLIRLEHNALETIGLLLLNNEIFSFTLEPPWKDNEPGTSSIPTGLYQCRRTSSPNFGETFAIMNVPERENVIVHWGNTSLDTKGCVLVGNRVGVLFGKRAVLGSKETFRNMMEKLSDVGEFELEVSSWTGTGTGTG